jgi:hypothetical protein
MNSKLRLENDFEMYFDMENAIKISTSNVLFTLICSTVLAGECWHVYHGSVVFLLFLDFLKKNMGKWLTGLFCVMNFCLVPILHRSLHTKSILPSVHTGLSKASIASARTIENDLTLEMVSVLTT